MFPVFAILNAASFAFSMANQFWLGAAVNFGALVMCQAFALAVERLEKGSQ